MECMEGGELFDRVREKKVYSEKDVKWHVLGCRSLIFFNMFLGNSLTGHSRARWLQHRLQTWWELNLP